MGRIEGVIFPVCIYLIHVSPLSRELCETLTQERNSLSKTKAYLQDQQVQLRERKAALKQTHKEWNKGMKLHGEARVRTSWNSFFFLIIIFFSAA